MQIAETKNANCIIATQLIAFCGKVLHHTQTEAMVAMITDHMGGKTMDNSIAIFGGVIVGAIIVASLLSVLIKNKRG